MKLSHMKPVPPNSMLITCVIRSLSTLPYSTQLFQRRSWHPVLELIYLVNLWEQGRKIWKSIQRVNPKVMEEFFCCLVEDGPLIRSALPDKPAKDECSHHPINIDATDRGNLGPRDRLPIRNYSEGFQGRFRELRVRSADDKPFHHRRVISSCEKSPPPIFLSEVYSAVLVVKVSGDLAEAFLHLVEGTLSC